MKVKMMLVIGDDYYSRNDKEKRVLDRQCCDRHKLLFLLEEYSLLALKAIIMQLLVKMHERKILYNTIEKLLINKSKACKYYI